MPARVRGGVVSRTGDRVGDALDMRTRRVGVEGFVAFGGERSILLFLRLPGSCFFLPRAALSHCFWAAAARVCGALMAHDYVCTTSRCPTVFNWARQPIFEFGLEPALCGADRKKGVAMLSGRETVPFPATCNSLLVSYSASPWQLDRAFFSLSGRHGCLQNTVLKPSYPYNALLRSYAASGIGKGTSSLVGDHLRASLTALRRRIDCARSSFDLCNQLRTVADRFVRKAAVRRGCPFCTAKRQQRQKYGPHTQQGPQAPAPAQLLGGLLPAALHAFTGVLVLVLPGSPSSSSNTTTFERHHRALPPQHFGLVRAGPPMAEEAVCGRYVAHDDAVVEKRRLDASIRGKEGAGRHVS